MTAPNTTWIWLYMLPVKQTTDRIAEWQIIEKEGMLLRERLEFSWKECFNFAIKAKPNTMKICILSKPVIFCAIWSTLSVAVYGQQDKITLQRGARPYIDYTKISPGDILPGTIRIRLDDDFSGLQAEDVTTGSDGCIRFGIPALDALNREAGVTGAKPVFFIALRNQRFHERHQFWGLELWYDLHISRESNTLELMSRYAALPEIASAEVLVKATLASAGTAKTVDWIPQDSLYLQQWDFNNTGQTGGTPGCDIHMSDAWEIERGDTGIVVAIMDQGVAYEHPDLQANMWEGIGYNFYADTTLIEPCLHGTHVAGTISANTNNGIGVSGIAGGDGTGNGVRIMSCQIISADNTVVEENIPNAFIWAADQGASISQNSWNLPTASPALLEAIDYFIANGGGGVLNGGILICSAGNSDTNAISYPACYEPCIAVAATSHNDIRSFYSNYGPWVSLSAPGGNYYPFNEEDILSTMPGDTYGYLMGTSMACPHVSGVAALIVSLTKGILVPEEVKDILLYSTDDISQLNPQYNGMLGTGRLNAYKALLMAQGYLNPDIPKPVISLTATNGGPGALKVQWEPNASQDSVLLAFSRTGKFGVPTGTFHPGDTIPGGGEIIYKGTVTEFTQTGLDSGTVCHYSIWSLRYNVYSVFGRTVSDTVRSTPQGISTFDNQAYNRILISPNPVVADATLEFTLEEPGEILLTIYTVNGEMVFRAKENCPVPGIRKLTVSPAGWKPGIYYPRIISETRMFVGKMVVGM